MVENLFPKTNSLYALIDNLIKELPPEKQIESLESALQLKSVWDNSDMGQLSAIVKALEKLFDMQLDDYRICLMEIYKKLPIQIDGDKSSEEKIEAAPSFKLLLLEKIIKGWQRKCSDHRIDEHATNCFLFFCHAYNSAPFYYSEKKDTNPNACKTESSFRKHAETIFREHLKESYFSLDELDHWILNKGVPDEILKLIAHFQINKGGGYWIVKRTKILQDLKNK